VPRTRPPYPEGFRREAIRLAQLGDKLSLDPLSPLHPPPNDRSEVRDAAAFLSTDDGGPSPMRS
jgi:hypothetical protein